MTSRLDARLAKLELVRGDGWREWADAPITQWPTVAIEACLAECAEKGEDLVMGSLSDEQIQRIFGTPLEEVS